MKTYSMDLRERVVRACDQESGAQKEIADLFGVSTAWIRRLVQRRRETGSSAPQKRGTRKPPKFFGPSLEKLTRLVEEQPDATLQELLDRSGVDGSIMAVHRALERLGCRRKKVAPCRRARPPGREGSTRRLVG